MAGTMTYPDTTPRPHLYFSNADFVKLQILEIINLDPYGQSPSGKTPAYYVDDCVARLKRALRSTIIEYGFVAAFCALQDNGLCSGFVYLLFWSTNQIHLVDREIRNTAFDASPDYHLKEWFPLDLDDFGLTLPEIDLISMTFTAMTNDEMEPLERIMLYRIRATRLEELSDLQQFLGYSENHLGEVKGDETNRHTLLWRHQWDVNHIIPEPYEELVAIEWTRGMFQRNIATSLVTTLGEVERAEGVAGPDNPEVEIERIELARMTPNEELRNFHFRHWSHCSAVGA